jgi:hypothetical protein
VVSPSSKLRITDHPLFASPNGESEKAWKANMISEREFNHDGDEDFTRDFTASPDQDYITLFISPKGQDYDEKTVGKKTLREQS